MGETYLSRAAFNLEMAQYSLRKLDDGDDRVLNVVGYQLQQAVELFLKHYLETESTGFPFSHDIDVLLDLLDEAGTSAVLTDEIRAVAGSLTLWEARTRYVKDYVASRKSILHALCVIEDLFSMNGLEVSRTRASEPDAAKIDVF